MTIEPTCVCKLSLPEVFLISYEDAKSLATVVTIVGFPNVFRVLRTTLYIERYG